MRRRRHAGVYLQGELSSRTSMRELLARPSVHPACPAVIEVCLGRKHVAAVVGAIASPLLGGTSWLSHSDTLCRPNPLRGSRWTEITQKRGGTPGAWMRGNIP